MHTVAPRSNTVWLNSHESPAGTRRSPNRVARAGVKAAPDTARARTRMALVSTAATSSPNANERTARAVYGPTPARERSMASSRGTPPSCSVTTVVAARCRFSARRLYPRPDHWRTTAARSACAQAPGVGKTAMKRS